MRQRELYGRVVAHFYRSVKNNMLFVVDQPSFFLSVVKCANLSKFTVPGNIVYQFKRIFDDEEGFASFSLSIVEATTLVPRH